MLKRITVYLGAALLLACALPVLAADPTSDQIYQALRAGNVASAQQMIAQVLRDHPENAKAHFVAAEVDARAGNFGSARQELQTAESLKPGLPFASPRSVSELQQQLGEPPLAVTSIQPPVRVMGRSSHLGLFLFLIGGAVVLWLVLRRRARAMGYGQYPGGQYGQYPGGAPPGVPPVGYGQGGYPGGYMPGGGPGIMGSVASGLALGAGVAAGEALVDRMIGGGTNTGGGGFVPPAQAEPPPDPNADMGGNDFGLDDPGSWDDGGGGGGDDGGGWT